MRRRALTMVIGVALAATVVPSVRADVVEVGSESEEQVEGRAACGYWDVDTANGYTVVKTCATEEPSASWAHVEAERRSCESSGHRTECQTTRYSSYVDPAAVDMDVEAGTAWFGAQLGDCALDVSVVADERTAYDWSSDPDPFIADGRIGLRSHGYEAELASGVASGVVCDWAEAAGDGQGSMSEWSSSSSSDWVRPDYELLAPVLSHGGTRQDRRSTACGHWSEPAATGDVHVHTCGQVSDAGPEYLYASRAECSYGDQGWYLCEGVFHADEAPSADEVIIDAEAGTAHLDGDAGSCVIDVGITLTQWEHEESYGSGGGSIQPGAGPDGVTLSQHSGWYYRYGSGDASGDVCGWPEADGPGDGGMSTAGDSFEYIRVGPAGS